MKKIIHSILTIFAMFFLWILPAQAAIETYVIDPNHTFVLWHISHFGFSNPTGKWMAKGIVEFDAEQPQNSKVSATIRLEDVSTGIPELDKHLKGELFFNVAKFPESTFISDQITMTGKDTAKVQGILTLKGISRPIVLAVRLNKMGINPVNNKQGIGFSGTTQFKRSDFGMTALLPGLGDEVQLDIEAEAYKQ